jgi:hypothetical protein
MSDLLYKITASNGSPVHGGRGVWPLPTEDGPGAWWEVDGELVLCKHGLHLCRVTDVSRWVVVNAVVWQAEADGEIAADEDKVVARRARLVRRVGALTTAVLATLAADCAERVLPIWEAKYPGDARPRRAIEAASSVSSERAAAETVEAAAKAAAVAASEARSGAAEAAAVAASEAARVAANCRRGVAWASWASVAAVEAAAMAVSVAAEADARANERRWQGERLLALLSEVQP